MELRGSAAGGATSVKEAVCSIQCSTIIITEGNRSFPSMPLYSHKAENSFVRMRNRCITYVMVIYVTFSTFNALNVFVPVQRGRDGNLII